jgi:spermidine/putrescine-binding protein
MDELMRLKRGSVTGLGLASAVLARETGLFSTPAFAEDLGKQMSIATWPDYHDPATFETFTAATGVAVEVNVFGSNEEMLAKLQAGGTGWDLFVPTNYTISTYVKLGLIDALDMAKLPNYSASTETARSRPKAWSTARPMQYRKTGALPASQSVQQRSRLRSPAGKISSRLRWEKAIRASWCMITN